MSRVCRQALSLAVTERTSTSHRRPPPPSSCRAAITSRALDEKLLLPRHLGAIPASKFGASRPTSPKRAEPSY